MFVSVVAVGLCLLFSLFIWWIRKSNGGDQGTLTGLFTNKRPFPTASRQPSRMERDLMMERLDQVLARPGEPPFSSIKTVQSSMEVAPLHEAVSEPLSSAAAADGESAVHEVLGESASLAAAADGESAVHEVVSESPSLAAAADGESAVHEVVSESLPSATAADGESAVHEVVTEPLLLAAGSDSESAVLEDVSEPLPLATAADSESAVHEVVGESPSLAAAADGESAVLEDVSETLPLTIAADGESAVHEVVTEPLLLTTAADSEPASHEVVTEPLLLAAGSDSEYAVIEAVSEPFLLATAADGEPASHEVVTEPLLLAAGSDREYAVLEDVSETLPLTIAADSESALHEAVSEPLSLTMVADSESAVLEDVSETLPLTMAADSQSALHEIVSEPLPWATAADGESVGAAILESALKIDPQILHEIEISTTHELYEIADLYTYVQDHFFATPVESTEEWFSRLAGYVAGQRGASISEQMNCRSWREVSLLIEEQAIVDRSLVDARMDVAGKGGGAVFGVRVDANVRGAGTKIGGVLGSIAGGTMNKTASAESRRAPLQVARDKYNTMITSAQSAIYADIESSKQEVLWLQTECQSRFNDLRVSAETEAKEKINSFNGEFESKLLECYLRLPEFLYDFSEQLREKEFAASNQMPRVKFWHVVTRPQDLRKRMANWFWFRRAQAKISKDLHNFDKIEPKTPETLHSAVQKILKDCMIDHPELKQELEAISALQNDLKKAAEGVRSQAIEQVDANRQSLIKEFVAQVNNLQDEIVATVERWHNKVAAAREDLRRQAAAVGISI